MGDKIIQIFEFGWLRVGEKFGANCIEFKEKHFTLLQQYITQNHNKKYYQVYYNKVRFANFVGVIKVADLTIEVLPKTDRHNLGKSAWREVLIEMLMISLQVEVETTTLADLNVKHLTVLETYMHLFLNETEKLLHHGLIKKYRKERGNQYAIKGKLITDKQASLNFVHAERFFVEHNIFDRNNIYNQIILKALLCIKSIGVSQFTRNWSSRVLIDFPQCNDIKVTESTLNNITYDRKSSRYKAAIQLAKIILLNFHPDIRGGNENVLAIMFDMNLLWETYIYAMLNRANKYHDNQWIITPQAKTLFWRHPDNWSYNLKPDLLLKNRKTKKALIMDTKWKFQANTSIEDVRQMYAYGNFFSSKERYLLYPDLLDKSQPIEKKKGLFFIENSNEISCDNICGFIFIDLIDEKNRLNKNIGINILNQFANA